MEKDLSVQAEIIGLLSKKIEERTDTEWQLLYNYTSSISFFQKYVVSGYKNIPQECCKVLQPLEMKKGDIVFYINTEGTKFYIIIQGEVGLFTKKVEEGPGNKFDNLVQVKSLEEGDYFGELGLLNFKTRSATVQCLTDCFFAVIDKISFDKILKKLEQDILQERIDAFVNENPLLKYSSKHTIKQLYFNAIFKNYAPNEFVIISGEPLEAIFIIKSGQYKLVKEYNRKTILDTDQEIDEEHEQNEYQVLNQDKYFLQLQKQKKRLISILDLGKGQIFGYEDFLQKNSIYSYGIVCKEAGEVIMIRSNDFRKRLMSDKLTMIYLKKQMNLQTNYIQHREATIVRSIEGYTQFCFQQDLQQDKAELISKMCVDSTGIKLDIPKTIIQRAQDQNSLDKNLKYSKVHSKLSHFKDELSQDFKNKIVKNYQEKFGNTEMSKLQVHVPQEIVQQVNYKLNKKKNLNIEKSPPQLSNSIFDYFKSRTSTVIQFIQNKSSAPLLSASKEYNTPISIQSATIEYKNSSLQNSPTLAHLQSPLLSAKSHQQDYFSESPIKTSQSTKNFHIVSQKALHSNASLPQSIEEIDEFQIKSQPKRDSYSQFFLHMNMNKKIRHQSEIIQLQKTDSQETKVQFQFGNSPNQGESNTPYNKKTHSLHTDINKGENLIEQKNDFKEEDEEKNNYFKQIQNKQQKLQIFESIYLKNKKNKNNSSHRENDIIQQNNVEQSPNFIQNRLLQIQIYQDINNNKNKNSQIQVNDSPNNSSVQLNTLQTQNSQTPLAYSKNSISMQQEQYIKYEQQIKQNNSISSNQSFKALSPTFNYSQNVNLTNKIQQLKHSDSNDSNQSQKSKGNSNYYSLFKPYHQNQARVISSTFSQIDSSKKGKSLDREVKYLNESGVSKNQINIPKHLQTTSASSLGLSRLGNQLDQQDKDSETMNNSVLSSTNNNHQISTQNFVFEGNLYNRSNSNLTQNQIENKNENFQLFTNVNIQDLNILKAADESKKYLPNQQNKSMPYIGHSINNYFNSIKRESTNSIPPISEILEQPIQEQSKNEDLSNKHSNNNKNNIIFYSQRIHSQQNIKRMQTFSPSKKQDVIMNFNSRTSFGELISANQLEEISKNPSQLIVDMVSQVENLNLTQKKPDNKILYRSLSGKKFSLSKSKPVYKFEQIEQEENMKKSNSQNHLIPQLKTSNFLKFDQTLKQILSPKALQKLNNNISSQLQYSPSFQLKKNETVVQNNSISLQIPNTKLSSPQKSINVSSQFIKTKRPLSSVANKSQSFQNLTNNNNNSSGKLRPSSAKPIDFFSKLLNKKFD